MPTSPHPVFSATKATRLHVAASLRDARFVVPASAGSDRLKAALQATAVPPDAPLRLAQPQTRGTNSPKRNAGLGDPGLRDSAKTALRSDLVLQLDHRCRSRSENFLDEIDPTDLLRQPLAATSLADLDSAALDLMADAGLLARTVTTVCPADLQARLAEVRTERDLWLATGMAGILITLLADRRPSVAIEAAESILTRLPQSQSANLPRGHAAIASQLLDAIGLVDAGLLLDEDRHTLARLLSDWTANRQCVLPRATVAQIAVGHDPAPAQVRSAISVAGMQGLRQLAAVLSAYRGYRP